MQFSYSVVHVETAPGEAWDLQLVRAYVRGTQTQVISQELKAT